LDYLTPDNNYWVVDIEANGLHDATKIWVVVVRNVLESSRVHTFIDSVSFCSWLHDNDVTLVGHNLLSFDVPTLNRLWGTNISHSRCVDTLVLSYLYNPVMSGGHSLKAWGERLKCLKSDFDDWSHLSEEMIEYCVQDTLVTVKLYVALTTRMKKYGWSELSASIEHNFRVIIDEQQRNGFYFDREGALRLYESLRSSEDSLGTTIRSKFAPRLVSRGTHTYRTRADGTPYASFTAHEEKYQLRWLDNETYEKFEQEEFNIASPKQRIERLLELGWEPTSFTKTGQPQVNEEALVAFAESSKTPEVQMIADWLVINGRANMINTWLENLDDDSCIRGRVNSCGAGTRRCTHSSPNTANIPGIYARFGKESRGLWCARPNRVMVGIDASGLEGRVFIHYLGSKEAEEFMLNDPHTANSLAISRAIGFPVTRSHTKNLFYARLYGASDSKLGRMVGAADRGKLIREAIDGNIPGFAELVQQVEREWKTNDTRIQTIDGGYVWCPSPHAALNYKFQSCGAIVMKVAAQVFKDSAGHLDYLKVGDIHDEWQLDTNPDHADEVGRIGCEAMTTAGEILKMNIRLDGEYKIGRNWAETH